MALPSLSSQRNNIAFILLPVFCNSFASQHIGTISMCLVKWSSAGQARSWHAVSDEENLFLLSKQSLLSAVVALLSY